MGHGMRRRGHSWRSRSGQRGAVATEYALGAALLVIGSITIINAFEDNAGTQLRADGATLGAPDLPDVGMASTTSSTVSATTAPPTSAPPSTVTASASLLNATATKHGNSWSPTVRIQALDTANGQPLTSGTITARWTRHPQETTQDVQCALGPGGTCTFTLANETANGPNVVSSIDFVVTGITGTNPVITYTPSAPLATTLNLADA